MILPIIFATNVDGGTELEAGTPHMITRKYRICASSNLLPEILWPFLMRTPLVEEACIQWEVCFGGNCRKTLVMRLQMVDERDSTYYSGAEYSWSLT